MAISASRDTRVWQDGKMASHIDRFYVFSLVKNGLTKKLHAPWRTQRSPGSISMLITDIMCTVGLYSSLQKLLGYHFHCAKGNPIGKVFLNSLKRVQWPRPGTRGNKYNFYEIWVNG